MIDTKRIETITRLINSDATRVTSDETAIDFAALLRTHIKELSAVEKTLTGELTGDVVFDRDTDQGNGATIMGVDFYANISETVRWSLDAKAVKAEMGQEWYDARCKTSTVRSVKYLDK